MARFTKTIVNLIFAVMAMFMSACDADKHNEVAEDSKTIVKVSVEPMDSIHWNYRDPEGHILLSNVEARGCNWIKVEPTKYANAKEAWKPSVALYKAFTSQVNTTVFEYNHGDNTIETGVKFIVRENRVISLSDNRQIVLTKNEELPLYKPERLNLKGGTPSTEVLTEKPFYAETSVKYQHRYGETVILAEDVQPFVAEEGYLPAFESMLWDAWHKGPATASYANGIAIVQCPDTLWAKEKWDNGEYKNELSRYTHSKCTFSVAVSGTEVTSISAVVGKDLTVSGNKASVAEFTVTVDRTSKDIVEKSVPYTYNGKSINFVDSLHACGYKLKGGKVTSKTNVRLVFVRENGTDEVSVDVPVTLTEKLTLKEVERSYNHKAFRKNASVSNYDMDLICDNDATFVKVWSNGTKDDPVTRGYTWTLNFKYNVPSGLTVDVIGHTYNFTNGTAVVEGKNVTVTFSSRSISDIMFENKNYKSEAPQCSATVKTITFNSKTQATVVFDGEKEGEVISAIVPVNLIETEIIQGKIVAGWATDSYESSTNFHYNWHSCTYQILVLKDGIYTVYSRDVNATSGYRKTNISSALATNGFPLAYVGDNGEAAIGYISQNKSQGSWHKIVYLNADGSLDKALSDTEHTMHQNDELFQRNPVRGTWSNGKIVADGHVWYVIGSEN